MKLDVSIIRALVDTDRIEELIRGTYMEKYAQHNAEIRRAIRTAKRLQLDLDPKELSILDLGCGIGWFCHVCGLLGHYPHGLDQSEFMHAELAEVLEFPFFGHKMTAGNPLPQFPPEWYALGCDLVTMIATNTHGDLDLITSLNAALLRIVRTGGRFYRIANYPEAWTLAPRYYPGWKVLNRGARHILLEKK